MSDKEILDEQMQPQLVPGLMVGAGWNQPFIGEEVLPPTPVDSQDFFYEVWGNEGLVDDGQTKRALHSRSKILTPPKNSTVRGYLFEHSSKMPLDVNVINASVAADRQFPRSGLSRADRRRQVNMLKLVFNEKIQREKEVAALVFDATKYDSDLQTTSISFKTCTISDIKDCIRDVQARTGFAPDTLVLGYKSRTSFDDNENFLDRINGGATATDPAVVTDALLGSLITITDKPIRVVKGMSIIQPKALPGELAPSHTALWTEDSAAMIYSGNIVNADEASPAFGKVFYMNVPGTNLRYGAWSWPDAEPNTVEWQKIAEYRLVAQTMQAGYFFGNADA
jgi:hypothetical protein